jgi:hypothetical protein
MATLIYSAITRIWQSLPRHVRLKLELLDERRFGNGGVHLHYRTRT